MRKSYLVFGFVFLFLQTFAQTERPTWQDLMKDPDANFYDIQNAFNEAWKDVPRPYPKGKGFMSYKRWEWFMEPRVYPTGKRPAADAVQRAMMESPGMFPLPTTNNTQGSWSYIGNTSVPTSGGGVGRINAVRPLPGSTTTFFACAPGGGLWKTTNSGGAWTMMNTDNLSSIGVTDIAIDPNNTNIMYISTGDGDAGDTYSLGVLKSTDGGLTWNTTGLNWSVTQTRTCRKLIMHPTNSSILLVATSNGIYKTTDAGANWTQVQAGSFYDLEFKTDDPTIIFAASTGFYKSTDTGGTFTQITSGLPASNVSRMAIAVSAANSAVVYVLAGNSTNQGLTGVYKSTNSGTSFSTAATTPNLLGWNSAGNDTGGQAWYDLSIECNGSDANMVWVGGVNIWKSTNGGTSWACNAHWYGDLGLPYVHADIHCLQWVAGSSSLWVGCDGGVFTTSNNGTTYSDASSNLQVSQQYRIGIAELNANKFLTGWQDNGTNLKNAGNFSQVLGGDGMECIIARTDANVMYGEIYYGNIYKSTNGGGTFSSIVGSGGAGVNADGNWVTPYCLGATDNDLYVGKSTIYKSSNAGTSFTAMGTFGTGNVSCFAVAASNVSIIYAAKGATLYKTTNANTFSALSGLPNVSITAVCVDPANASRVWVTLSGYTAGTKVYFSSDGGATWSNVSGSLPNIPANHIVYQTGSADGLYVAMDAGVYYKDNSLADWVPYMNGLPNVVVDELEIHYGTNTITAATFGRGTWRAPLYAQPNLDLALVSVDSPSGNVCSTTVTPIINVMNTGLNDVTAFELSYTITGQATQTYSWTGTLASGNALAVSLPNVTLTAGSYTLSANLTSVNAGVDDNSSNDAVSSNFSIVAGAANDVCSSATALTVGAAYVTANNTVTCTDGPDPSCGGSGIHDVWYSFVYTGGDITIQTNTGTMSDTRIALFYSCGATTSLACNDDISATNYNSRINIACSSLVNGHTYYIQAGGYAAGTGTFGIQVLASTIAGCTNSSACNYNPCANSNNGSCVLPTTYYLDADADTYYVSSISSCTNPGAGYVTSGVTAGDCNDASASVHPGATEVCGNGIDEDCSGADLPCVIPGCMDNTACNYNAAATVSNGSCTYAVTYYADVDGDTYGNTSSTTSACSQPVGYVTNNTDCNDGNAAVHPGATEVCNGIDDDCDSSIDEGVQNTYYRDFDSDTYGNLNVTTQACSAPAGYVSNSTDCNDNNAAVHPGATEVCNGIDDDCDLSVDEGVLNTYYADTDLDGYGNLSITTQACSAPAGYVSNSTDCNDASAAVHPGATEACNSIDDDCDLLVDEGVLNTYYADSDLDGYGNSASSTLACSAPAGYVSNSSDCNDANALVNPLGTEVCNGIDDDCDLAIDEGVLNTYYADADSDGYGNSAVTTAACSVPAGYSTNNTDCNDASASVNPGATEICGNSIDDDCIGGDAVCTISGCTNASACNYVSSATIDDGSCTYAVTYYLDADGDGYYVSSVVSCTNPGAGYTTTAGINGDCNDANAAIAVGTTEVCNGVDDDCDGLIDEGVSTTYYRDLDGDTYGDPNVSISACSPQSGYVTNNQDCNDASSLITPNTLWYADVDGDGYGVSPVTSCTSPGAGWGIAYIQGGDCNDANSAIHPNAVENCSTAYDDNCNLLINEGCNPSSIPGDEPSNALSVTVSVYPNCTSASGNLVGKTASAFAHTTCLTGEDLWYSFIPTTEAVSVLLNSSTFDGLIELQDASGNLIDFENSVSGIGNEILNYVGLTAGTPYRIGVRNYNSANGNGVFSVCVRQLKRGGCDYGAGPYSLCQVYKATWAGTGTQYRYVFTGTSGPATGNTYTRLSSSDLMVLSSVTPTLPYGSSYQVTIKNVYTIANGAGVNEVIEVPNSTPCIMSTVAEPATQLATADRCSTGPKFRGSYVSSQPWICGISNWKWRFTEVNNLYQPVGIPIVVYRNASSNALGLGTVSQLQSGKTYAVETAPVFSYGDGAWGPTQYMCILGPAGMILDGNDSSDASNETVTRMVVEDSAPFVIYPNPSQGTGLTIQVNEVVEGAAQFELWSQDQRKLVSKTINLSNNRTAIEMPQALANGTYIVVVKTANEIYQEKWIVIK